MEVYKDRYNKVQVSLGLSLAYPTFVHANIDWESQLIRRYDQTCVVQYHLLRIPNLESSSATFCK